MGGFGGKKRKKKKECYNYIITSKKSLKKIGQKKITQ